MRWEEDFGDYHSVGDSQCPACMLTPVRCQCEGWIQTQLDQDNLIEIQMMCDICHITEFEDSDISCAG